MRIAPVFVVLLSVFAAFATANALDDVAAYGQSFENGDINLLQLKVLLNDARDELTRSVENELIRLDPEDPHFRGWPKETAVRLLGEPTRQEHWVWIENRQESQYVTEPQPMWDRVLFGGEKLTLRVKAHPHAIEQDGQLLPFYWIDFQTQLNTGQEKPELSAALEQMRVMFALHRQTGQGLQDITNQAVLLERSLQLHDISSAACEETLTGLLKQSLNSEDRLIWCGRLYQGPSGAILLQVDERQDPHWRNLNPGVEVQVNYPFHSTEPLDQNTLRTQPADSLLDRWNAAVKALHDFGPSDPFLSEHVEAVQSVGNALNEKANRDDDAFTVEQWQAALEDAFAKYASDFSKTVAREKNIRVPLLSVNRTHQRVLPSRLPSVSTLQPVPGGTMRV